MKITWFCFFLLVLGDSIPTLAQTQDRHVPGQILVALQPGIHPMDFLPAQQTNIPWSIEQQVAQVPLNIWLLSTSLVGRDFILALDWLKQQPEVDQWQYNHYLDERKSPPDPRGTPLQIAYPNDPKFSYQWHFENTGQNGGTVGADLGMIDAWDITTGGLTPSGDTVVVAVIDGGLCPYCDDWGNNIWKNHHEIPGDGIDNDANGYFDDYLGWNVNAQDDNIIGYSTGHGTSVSGIIAAKGNDNIGLTGMMWDTKLMFVAGTSGPNTTESQILGAYEYVYKARKTYNDTQGAKGAFVVSVNCSFGINFGTPTQSPLWCEVLDQLGEVGILTIGAVANGDWDVDEVGDIPSTCPSNYLITTTSINNIEEKSTNAAFGQTAVDIAAFGTSIYTLTPGSPAYDYKSGTSFAAPQVSAAVGLLYTAPCHNLTALAKENPSAAAIWAKNLIMESVKPLPSLANITASGGRLQANTLLHHYENQCQLCPPPYWLNTQNVTTGQAQLKWVESAEFEQVDLRWRATGDTTWSVVYQVQSPYLLTGLSTCVSYEFSVRAQCDTATQSQWSPAKSFTTDGCCLAPQILGVATDSAQTAQVFWQSVTAAQAYNIRYRSINTIGWAYAYNIEQNDYIIDSLSGCTDYEVQVQSNCAGGNTAFSLSKMFQTSGCGACYDKIYCNSSADNATEEWIEKVEIANIWSNESLGNQGYQDFSGRSDIPIMELFPNMSLSATVTPGFASSSFFETHRIFIDFNMDGDFDDPQEMVYNPGFAHNGAITAAFNVPGFSSQGITRMRVSMKYKEPGIFELPAPCESFSYGQVEDYCVNLSQPLSTAATHLVLADVSPNPFGQSIAINIPLHTLAPTYILSETTGRVVQRGVLKQGFNTIDGLGHLASGVYILKITTETGAVFVKKLVKI